MGPVPQAVRWSCSPKAVSHVCGTERSCWPGYTQRATCEKSTFSVAESSSTPPGPTSCGSGYTISCSRKDETSRLGAHCISGSKLWHRSIIGCAKCQSRVSWSSARFFGSGTTAVVAVFEGQRFLGSDIDAGSVETTQRRLVELEEEPASLGELPSGRCSVTQLELHESSDRGWAS